MTPEQLRALAGGHAPGNLTAAEKQKLYAAALQDQALFDALMEEEPLRDVLSDAESRGYVEAALEVRPPAPLRKPFPYWMAAAAAMIVIVGGSLLWQLRQPDVDRVDVASVAKNQPVEKAPPPPPPPPAAPLSAKPVRKKAAEARKPAEGVGQAIERLEEAQPEHKVELAKAVSADAAAAAPAAPAAVPPPPPTAKVAERREQIAVSVFRVNADGSAEEAPAIGPFRAGEKILLRLRGNLSAGQAVSTGSAPVLPLRRAGEVWEAGPIELVKGTFAAVLTPAPRQLIQGIRSQANEVALPAPGASVTPPPVLIRFQVE